jgi:hypothetical protein
VWVVVCGALRGCRCVQRFVAITGHHAYMGQDTGVPASCWLAEQGTVEARTARTRRLAALLGETMAKTGCGCRSVTRERAAAGRGRMS